MSIFQENASEGQKSFILGTFAESFVGLQEKVTKFLPSLLHLLVQYTSDKSDEARNNAIFGIGEMALHGKSSIYPYPF